jgi:hypothetical protein
MTIHEEPPTARQAQPRRHPLIAGTGRAGTSAPVRCLDELGLELWGTTPGGTVFPLNSTDHACIRALGFHQLLERLAHADVPQDLRMRKLERKLKSIWNNIRDRHPLKIYALKICLDEIRYRLSSLGGTASTGASSDTSGLPHTCSVAVIYVARGHTEEERKSIRIFLDSYKKYASGRSHKLYVIYKGFDTEILRRQTQNSFDAPHVAIELGDENLDLGAYIEASRLVEDDYVFLLNTHSEIRTDNWLEKITRPLADERIGMVGCTGSFESLSALSPLFPSSPNPHLRSNAIALDRLTFVNMLRDEKITKKFDAWLIESGPNSITNRIKLLNKRCVVVDNDGAVYEEEAWPGSGVFRNLFKQKAPIIDNQIREFESARFIQKLEMSFHAWGAIR